MMILWYLPNNKTLNIEKADLLMEVGFFCALIGAYRIHYSAVRICPMRIPEETFGLSFPMLAQNRQ